MIEICGMNQDEPFRPHGRARPEILVVNVDEKKSSYDRRALHYLDSAVKLSIVTVWGGCLRLIRGRALGSEVGSEVLLVGDVYCSGGIRPAERKPI